MTKRDGVILAAESHHALVVINRLMSALLKPTSASAIAASILFGLKLMLTPLTAQWRNTAYQQHRPNAEFYYKTALSAFVVIHP
jgi:hypothetical protein